MSSTTSEWPCVRRRRRRGLASLALAAAHLAAAARATSNAKPRPSRWEAARAENRRGAFLVPFLHRPNLPRRAAPVGVGASNVLLGVGSNVLLARGAAFRAPPRALLESSSSSSRPSPSSSLKPSLKPSLTPSASSASSAANPTASMELWLDARSYKGGDDDGSGSGGGNDLLDALPAAKGRIASADAVLVSDDPNLSLFGNSGKVPVVYAQRGDKIFSGDDDDAVVVGVAVRLSDDSSGQDAAMALVGSAEWVLCDTGDDGDGGSSSSSGDDSNDGGDGGGSWHMIPAENLISVSRGTGTRVAVVVERAGDVVGLSRALELGVDALCVDIGAADELWTAAVEAREERRRGAAEADDAGTGTGPSSRPSIVTGKCGRLETSGGGAGTVIADRVCVDLVRNLTPTQGCWIGSSAKLTALVLSEAATSSYVPSRPFRVNAGPVHSYIVLGDGATTKYLAELRAGDEVLVHDAQSGEDRSVAVGRLKIEVRPCVMVGLSAEGEDATTEGQVFLQQAETVRLGQREGDDSFVRVTDLSTDAQADVLLRVVSSGTHVGKAYTGKVNER